MKTILPRLRLLWPAGVVALALLATQLPAGGSSPPALTVIMISLDGTRPEDLRDPELAAIGELSRRGATATHMTPVFPTNTFPNHVSLVTGVSPAVHGIVNNVFVDPQRGLYRYSGDPAWIEVEPLWAIADRHGVVSAAYYWIGSEGPWRNGHGPRHWRTFDSQTPEREKVAQILAWLDIEDPADRPRLITSWFRGADRAAHRFGPGSPEARSALRGQDRALGDLVRGLEERGAFETTRLLVVSDHGMVPADSHVDLNAALREADIPAFALGGGGIALVSFESGGGSAADVIALADSLGLSAHAPDDVPGGVSAANPRFGAVVVLAPVGTAISRGSAPPMRGAHGYLPTVPGMEALMIAAGTGIAAGSELGAVRAIDVAPTVLDWLGIPQPGWMEGRPIAALAANSDEAALAAESASRTGERP
jgi:predicted AlkP superfamily pyrophosphatase or phosphodiesterase